MKLYNNILQKVALYEYKRGIDYAKVDGKLYKSVNIFYIIAFGFTVAINLFNVFGISLSERVFSEKRNEFYTIICLTAALIIAFVFSIFKKHIWALICSFGLNVLSCVGLCLTFAPFFEYATHSYTAEFYWRHLIPLCLIVIFLGWLLYIAVRASLKQIKIYKKIVDNLYSTYHKTIEENELSDQEWDEILKNI